MERVIGIEDPGEPKALSLDALLSLPTGAAILGHVSTETTFSAVNVRQAATALTTPASPWQHSQT